MAADAMWTKRAIPIRRSAALPLLVLLGFALLSLPILTLAQQPSRSKSDQAPYTVYTGVREALTDVTVTDSHGRPIPDLPESAFHIYDNGRLQKILTFTPHTPSQLRPIISLAQPPLYSNDFLGGPPPVFNIVLIDATSMSASDQMYLNEQFNLLIDHLSTNEPIAIYGRVGPITEVYQGFTTNHALLRKALRQILPHLADRGGSQLNDYNALTQMAVFLSQYPGRKNILWFTAGSNYYLKPDPLGARDNSSLRDLYDTLEFERIALYPIDVRSIAPDGASAAGESSSAGTDWNDINGQHLLMYAAAEATGGQAVYSNNGLAASTEQIIARSPSFYTLAYSPNNIRLDNHWHRIRVTVAAPPGQHYHLRYRRGYFDDGSESFLHHQKTRTVLRARGVTLRVPNNSSLPVIFQARVTPLPGAIARHGKVPYSVHYYLPGSSFQAQPAGENMTHYDVGAAALVYDSTGSLASHKIQKITLGVLTSPFGHPGETTLRLDQQVNLPTGHVDLYLAVWDARSGRLGTIQIPLDVSRHHASSH